MDTVYAAFEKMARAHATRPFLCDPATWQALSYLEEGGLCTLRHGEERLVTPLSLSHMNALAYSSTAMILSAGCIIQLDRFHPQIWWECVVRSRATIVHYLGVMPAILLGLKE